MHLVESEVRRLEDDVGNFVIVKTSFSYVVKRTSGESLCLDYITEDGTPRLPGAVTQFTDVTECV